MSLNGAAEVLDEGVALDLDALASAARLAEDGEAYREISRSATHRIGVMASVYPSQCVYYSLECTFRMFPDDGGVEPAHLAQATDATRALQARGYDLAHLDGGWISCVKTVSPSDLAEEVRFLRGQVSNGTEGGDGRGSESTRPPSDFFTKEFFEQAAAWLNADPEWQALANRFSTRVVLTCVDLGRTYLLEVVDGHVAAHDAIPETVADFRFDAERAAWIEIMRGEADYYPLVRAKRMKFRGSVFRLRLKMGPLDRMTFAAQQVFRRR